MPFLLIYIIKFSISLAAVFLFYQFVLRKLTFYNWNRIYLLGYTLFSFVVPFIDISGTLQQNKLTESEMINWLPIFQLKELAVSSESSFTVWNIISLLLVTGIIFMTIRLLVQLVSFQRMMKKATLISNDGLQLYQVNEEIIPFSFGNSVFINSHLHTESELQEIIQHEIVHVKQKHSIDIIWSEILCLFNWFNPFAWLLRKAIRQNLEFIADNKVLDNGIDRKQYQYLLLKVIGNKHFSIATKFNFSSLKKRIAMMNKLKSTKLNLLRFLFVLPLFAVILVSFRKEIGDTLKMNSNAEIDTPLVITDTVPIVQAFTDKGYYIEVRKNKEKDNPLIIIKNKDKKEVERLTIDEWNSRREYFENLYGELPPPPPPPPPPMPQAPPAPPAPVKLPENVKRINVNNDVATVWLKNGNKESYDMSSSSQKNEFEKKYGKLPAPPAPPVPPVPPAPLAAPTNGPDAPNASTIQIKHSNGKTPLIVIDGEIVSEEVMAKLDKNTIQSIDVLKDKSATALYGDKGKDGVLLLKTKTKESTESNPLIVLDGKIISKTEMDNLNPDSIESVNVLKGKNATNLYADKGKEGVIVITSKK